MNALTSTRSPSVIVPLTTPTVARHMMSVTAMAMIALCPMLSADSDVWLLTACLFQPLEALVVPARLPLLVAEVLHRLVVEEAVDRARVGLAVEVVHRAPEMRAPFRDHHGERDVDRERAGGDRGERPVVARDQDRHHERDLDERGQDREQRVADERGDASLTALDIAREPARLPVQMESQRRARAGGGTP
jgi:hypothetical protein